MKRIAILAGLILMNFTLAYADILADGSNTFTTDTKTVVISTTCALPTQLLTVDNFLTRTWIVNQSTWTNLLISTSSVGISTNSYMIQPTPNIGSVFSPDGPMVPYWGQLFGCSTSTVSGLNTVPTNVSVLRTK